MSDLCLGARERTGPGEHVRRHQCCPGNGVCLVMASCGKPCILRKQQVHPLALQAQMASINNCSKYEAWCRCWKQGGSRQRNLRTGRQCPSEFTNLPSLSPKSLQQTQVSCSHARSFITPLYTIKPGLNHTGSHSLGRCVSFVSDEHRCYASH